MLGSIETLPMNVVCPASSTHVLVFVEYKDLC